MYKEKYWFQDITILTKNYQNIIPKINMTYPQKINALIRLLIIIGLVLSIAYYNHLFLYIPILGMLITYILYLFREQENIKNKTHPIPNTIANVNNHINNEIDNFESYLEENNNTEPNIDNPFMNPLPFDSRNRPPAINTITNDINKTNVDVAFDNGTYRDLNDIFDKNNAKRQFFTMPWTTYPNDQSSFANWLYKTPPTCKEGNGAQCIANYYIPLNRNLITPGVGSNPN